MKQKNQWQIIFFLIKPSKIFLSLSPSQITNDVFSHPAEIYFLYVSPKFVYGQFGWLGPVRSEPTN